MIYLDDVIVYSKKRADHPQHLKQIFERCRKYGISLNPKKKYLLFQKVNYWGILFLRMVFLLTQNTLNPSCRSHLHTVKRSMQSFLGKIDFMRRFVHDFSKIIKPLQKMIKNDIQFKWKSIEKEAFEKIKATIAISTLLSKVHISLKTFCCTLSLHIILLQ
jgi:hypothetical protein